LCITDCEWISHRLRMRAEVRHRWRPSATMRTLRRNLLCDSTPNEMFNNITMHAWLTPLYTELRLVSVVSENAARRQRKYLYNPNHRLHMQVRGNGESSKRGKNSTRFHSLRKEVAFFSKSLRSAVHKNVSTCYSAFPPRWLKSRMLEKSKNGRNKMRRQSRHVDTQAVTSLH